MPSRFLAILGAANHRNIQSVSRVLPRTHPTPKPIPNAIRVPDAMTASNHPAAQSDAFALCPPAATATARPKKWLTAAASSLTLVATLMATTGCSKNYIPNTDVEDSSENRKVVLFCEQYRHAVEDKDVGLLVKMASKRYYENGGNANVEDDIDYEGLKDYLTSTFLKTKTIRYEIRYRRVTFTERKEVLVDYSYAASYRVPGQKVDEWRHSVSDNRLVLVPDGDAFKIVSGM